MSHDPDQIGQSEIDGLLQSAQGGAPPPAKSAQDQAAGGESSGQQEKEPAQEPAKAASAPASAGPAAAPAAGANPSSGTVADSNAPHPEDVEYLLSQAEAALRSVTDADADMPEGAKPFELRDFGGSPPSAEAATISLVRDVQLDVKIELGRTHMVLEDVLKLRRGAVVTLDKLAGDPVDIYVNGRLIARGSTIIFASALPS